MALIDYDPSNREKLAALATAMLAGEVNLIEGVRKICSLRFAIGDPENDVFIPLRAIDSETDHFPLGEMRGRCSNDYLQRMDTEIENYLEEAGQEILDACRDIIQVYK